MSACGLYRYQLMRHWNPLRPVAYGVGLNPATADCFDNDGTTVQWIHRLDAVGYGGWIAGNLFAYRATDPEELKTAVDPVGPENDLYLRRLSRDADAAGVVIFWGTGGALLDRATYVLDHQLQSSFRYCLGTNADGSPRFPRGVPIDQPLVRWHPSGDE